MEDREIIQLLREHKVELINLVEKEIRHCSWAAQRYNSETRYEQMLKFKTLKYIIDNL